MMAHEIPIQVPPPNPSVSKTNKHKPVPQPIRQLPNGEMPNFGPAREKQPKHQHQLLPNGEKPNFGHESKSAKKKLKKKNANNSNTNNNANAPTKASGLVDNAAAAAAVKPQGNANDKSKKGEESYAGSSFHSSPEAVGLPKPSFRVSPKASAANIKGQTPQTSQTPQTPTQVHPTTGAPHVPPAFFYQGMPPAGPPRYPVTAYPSAGQYLPGFNYNANSQGFINYLYPPTAVPQPPIPMQSYPLGPPVQLFPQQQQYLQGPQAQKITFNQLMGSSK